MEQNIFKVGDLVRITGSSYIDELGKIGKIVNIQKTQVLVAFHDDSCQWYEYDCIAHAEEKPEKKETVNHPSHYVQNGIECFDVIKAALGDEGFKRFCEGNIIKYAFRMRYKGQYLDDVKKVHFYAEQIIKAHEVK